MATSAKWTIIFEDKKIIKNYDEGASEGIAYDISDDSFWSQSKFSNIWAVQYGTPNPTDTVEYRDETPHSTWEDANLGDILDFTTKWDSLHLASLQKQWDDDVIEVWSGEGTDAVLESTESEADQIARKGPRPTSYSSS